jgi:hypothetical protein
MPYKSRTEKVGKSAIKLMVPDLVYKFQMICSRGILVMEQKPNTD